MTGLGTDDGSLADGFVAGAAALAHVRADPLLPSELGPSAAAGDALRARTAHMGTRLLGRAAGVVSCALSLGSARDDDC